LSAAFDLDLGVDFDFAVELDLDSAVSHSKAKLH
jgi:hypothetical protein